MDHNNVSAARQYPSAIQPAPEPPSLSMVKKAAHALNQRWLDTAARIERVEAQLAGANTLNQAKEVSEKPVQAGAVDQLLDLIDVGKDAASRIEAAITGIERAIGA